MQGSASKVQDLPLKIVSITGAGGAIGYDLCFLVASGRLLGPGYRVHIKMIEIAPVVPSLEGLICEIEDGAFPLFAGATATSDPKEGFKDADYILLVGAKPRLPGMERSDLIKDNAKIFAAQGAVINEVASQNAKIVVVGNPVNTNAYVLAETAPKISKRNITSLTRLDYNRALSGLAKETGKSTAQVSNPIIWGNHSAKMCVDLSQVNIDGQQLPTSIDHAAFEKNVGKRGQTIMEKRGGKSSTYSAALAICDHVYDWVNGTKEGTYVAMGVFAPEGNEYGIPSWASFSGPVKCQNGEWTLVSGIPLTEQAKEGLARNIVELTEEKQAVEAIIRPAAPES
jgi:malate dehydrogenase